MSECRTNRMGRAVAERIKILFFLFTNVLPPKVAYDVPNWLACEGGIGAQMFPW